MRQNEIIPDTSLPHRELVRAMRRNEPEAFREFFRRFRPLLLAEARRLRIQPALCHEMVDECLGDVAMRLRRSTARTPRALEPYLIRALRLHRFALRRRERRRSKGERRDVRQDDALAAVIGTVLEATARASRAPDVDTGPTTSALERLASMVEEGLSAEEEQILSWVGRWVPQSDIAEWLGISHGAMRTRVMRLRARLKEVAMNHAATFTGKERAELSEFFRRTFATPHYTSLTRTSASMPRAAGGLITEDGIDLLIELAGALAFEKMDPLDPREGPFLDWLARDARMRQSVSERSEIERQAQEFADHVLQRVAAERAARPA
jgi:RNA polymerase sigma factor (sigma-70 family)